MRIAAGTRSPNQRAEYVRALTPINHRSNRGKLLQAAVGGNPSETESDMNTSNRDGMALRTLGSLFLPLFALAAFWPRPSLAGGVVGTGSAVSCTEAALDAALAGGGSVTFNCGPDPATITVTSTKTIYVDTAIDGGPTHLIPLEAVQSSTTRRP